MIEVVNIGELWEEILMNTLVKKTVVYSLAGIMQFGMFATVAEASSLYNEDSQRIVQLDRHDRNDRRDRDRYERDRHERERYERERRREHNERLRRENERHEREMRRRAHENEREWRERQRREKERHDRQVHEIAAFLLGIAIGSSSKD